MCHSLMDLSMKIFRRLATSFDTLFDVLKKIQIIVFVIHNLFDPATDKAGYLLLRCIRSYVELNTYAALEVHTEKTIAAGREEAKKFSSLTKVCVHTLQQI
jgi:hypothetical protein